MVFTRIKRPIFSAKLIYKQSLSSLSLVRSLLWPSLMYEGLAIPPESALNAVFMHPIFTGRFCNFQLFWLLKVFAGLSNTFLDLLGRNRHSCGRVVLSWSALLKNLFVNEAFCCFDAF
jgi:hypothetical protein